MNKNYNKVSMKKSQPSINNNDCYIFESIYYYIILSPEKKKTFNFLKKQ